MRRLAVPVPLALALVSAATAQFRVSVDVVRIDALVMQGDRPIGGLTADDFEVTEDGVAQAITVRALDRVPIDVVLTVDTSGSVQGPRLDRLRAAALALVGQLGPDDRGTLAVFDHLVELGPRDAAPSALADAVRALDANGGTALVDAVTAALIWSWNRHRPLLVLVFSDGVDKSSWTRGEQALVLARSSEAIVDAVVTGEAMPTSTTRIGPDGLLRPQTPDERFLAELTSSTGGRIRNGDAGSGLAGAFREALEQFRARYEITYTSSSQTPGWHAVDVRMRHRRGVTVHARRGYQR